MRLLVVVGAEDYLGDLGRFIVHSWRRFGRVRLIADWRNTPVQTSAVAERLGCANAELWC